MLTGAGLPTDLEMPRYHRSRRPHLPRRFGAMHSALPPPTHTTTHHPSHHTPDTRHLVGDAIVMHGMGTSDCRYNDDDDWRLGDGLSVFQSAYAVANGTEPDFTNYAQTRDDPVITPMPALPPTTTTHTHKVQSKHTAADVSSAPAGLRNWNVGHGT